MAAQKGLDMLIKVDSDGAGTYQTVAGLQAITFTFDKETVDITSQDDATRWRQLMSGAGVKSIRAVGRGVFKDSAADATLRSYMASDVIRDYQIIVPSFYQIQARFAIGPIEYSGEHNKEVQHSITLESAGDPTFTPL